MALTKQQKEELCDIVNVNDLCVIDILHKCDWKLKVAHDIEEDFERICTDNSNCVECFKEFFKLLP